MQWYVLLAAGVGVEPNADDLIVLVVEAFLDELL